jgi:hypothetical protein
MKYNFVRCNNATSSITCKSPEVIDQKLAAGGYLTIYMVDTSVTPTNFDQPVRVFGRNIFTSYTSRAYRNFNLYMKTVQIVNDIGWLTQDFVTQSYAAVESIYETWDYRDTSTYIFGMILRCASKRAVYNRYYVKVQEIAANVGGKIKFLLIVGKLSVYFFAKIQFEEYIVGHFFDDEDMEKIIEEKIKFRSKSKDFKMVKENSLNESEYIKNNLR